MNDRKKREFDEIESMTKEEAISEIKTFFKGNKKFTDHAVAIIYSTHNFTKLNKVEIQKDNYNWAKFLSIAIDTGLGFKQFYYRKGNKKYAAIGDREGNSTHDIDEFKLVIYHKETKEIEEFAF